MYGALNDLFAEMAEEEQLNEKIALKDQGVNLNADMSNESAKDPRQSFFPQAALYLKELSPNSKAVFFIYPRGYLIV